MPMKADPPMPKPDPSPTRGVKRAHHIAFLAMLPVFAALGVWCVIYSVVLGRWAWVFFITTMWVIASLSFFPIPFVNTDSDFIAIQRQEGMDERRQEIVRCADRVTHKLIVSVFTVVLVVLLPMQVDPPIWVGVAYASFYGTNLAAQFFYSRRM
jgi:hypothetical protein